MKDLERASRSSTSQDILIFNIAIQLSI
uniref:Uncharacterized protein n=1 Tax=Rhizophora mucronata TaxID=61149 RepID=A0A2P2NDR0_RHIMU